MGKIFLFFSLIGLTGAAVAQFEVSQFCFFGSGCSGTLTSTYAYLGPIRLSLLGGLIALVQMLAVPLPDDMSGKKKLALSFLYFAPAGVAVLYQFLAIFKLHSVCTWCILACLGFIGTAFSWHFRLLTKVSVQSKALAIFLVCGNIFAPLVRLPAIWQTSSTEQATALRAILKPEEMSDTLIFADFGCSHCLSEVPSKIREIQSTGRKTKVINISLKRSVSAKECALLAAIASARGLGDGVWKTISPTTDLGLLADSMRQELSPTTEDIAGGESNLRKNRQLFESLALKGTPAKVELNQRDGSIFYRMSRL